MRIFREKLWNLYLFLLFINISSSQLNPILHGSMLSELTALDLNQFKREAKYWTASGLVGTEMFSTCFSGSAPYLGGSNILQQGGYFERTYTNLPSHDIIYFSFKFAVIDLWNPSDTFSIYFDNKLIVPGWSPGSSVSGFPSDECGHQSSYDLSQMFAVGKAIHTASTLTVKFVSNLNTSPLIGGISMRYVILMFAHQQASDQEMTCSTVNPPSTVQGTNMCSGNCGPYQYYQGGHCINCVSPCSQCFGPAANQCYSLASNYYFDGYTAKPCASGCTRCFGPNPNQCNLCDPTLGYYNYWDHTCKPGCPSNMIKYEYYGLKCKTPCQDTGSFMLWDNTCSNTCDPPLVQRIEGLAKFCDFPCSPSQILYWNGVCSTDACEYPSKLSIISDRKICYYPCPNVNDYWRVLDNQCKPTCEYPFIVQIKSTVKYCVIDASPDEVDLEQKIAGVSNGMTIGMNAGSSLLSILTLDHTGLLFMTSLTEMLRYIQFLKLKFPPRLFLMLYQQNTTTSAGFGFIPKAPVDVRRAFTYQELPQEFQRNDLHSSFAVNSWRIVLSLCLILVVIILLFLIEIVFARSNSSLTKISEAIRWNFFFSMFTSCYSIIAFFTAIEFRTFVMDSFLSIFSFIACLVINIVGLLVMIAVFCVIQAFKNIKKGSNKLSFALKVKKTESTWSRYKIMFELYNRDFLSQQIFMFLFLLRAYIHYAIVGYFNEYPLAQTISLTVINVLMIGYLLLRRPLKILVNYIQQIVCEMILLIVNICMIIFAVMDTSESGSLQARAVIGDVVISANLGLSVITVAFLVVKVIIILYQMIFTKKMPEKIIFEEENVGPVKILSNKRQNDKMLPAPLQHVRVESGPNLLQRTRKTGEDSLNTGNTNPTQVFDQQWRQISKQPQKRVRVKRVKRPKRDFLPTFK